MALGTGDFISTATGGPAAPGEFEEPGEPGMVAALVAAPAAAGAPPPDVCACAPLPVGAALPDAAAGDAAFGGAARPPPHAARRTPAPRNRFAAPRRLDVDGAPGP
jgi:hypothetical protein